MRAYTTVVFLPVIAILRVVRKSIKKYYRRSSNHYKTGPSAGRFRSGSVPCVFLHGFLIESASNFYVQIITCGAYCYPDSVSLTKHFSGIRTFSGIPYSFFVFTADADVLVVYSNEWAVRRFRRKNDCRRYKKTDNDGNDGF